jgi:hypothetical protein
MKGLNVGELRISDIIGGHDNLRIIFYVAPKALKGEPLTKIWLLSVLQKKSMDFRDFSISIGFW